ncbi:hypothetical protein Anas_09255 [Armadillidium nasatum]|uniref:Uncharacterized protein n=1 Tax=Armadillidium nasatum TaxID=96803 RepID=A0A5N5SQL1_9CRUS|nr:hypothetical protein Anas_09255 [Armadillidium nasatum]
MEGSKIWTTISIFFLVFHLACVYFLFLFIRCESVSQRIRQSQGQSLLFNNLGTSLIIQSWIEEELNGGGVISMCSCTEYQITYQIRLLTSTFDDMRCTLLRLLEKVKNLELKNSLDVIKFFEHYISQCGWKWKFIRRRYSGSYSKKETVHASILLV